MVSQYNLHVKLSTCVSSCWSSFTMSPPSQSVLLLSCINVKESGIAMYTMNWLLAHDLFKPLLEKFQGNVALCCTHPETDEQTKNSNCMFLYRFSIKLTSAEYASGLAVNPWWLWSRRKVTCCTALLWSLFVFIFSCSSLLARTTFSDCPFVLCSNFSSISTTITWACQWFHCLHWWRTGG